MLREALTFELLSAMDADEAAACFVARGAEGLIPSEQELLADWLAADDAHRRAFERAGRAWSAFDDSDGDEILAAMRARALGAEPRRWAGWPSVAAAAAALLLVLASSLLLIPGRQPDAAIDYVSARGQVREIALPDGSRMILDADSAASGRFGADGREIRILRGRALFEVAHDRSRPFAVIAATHRVVATGTRFQVNLLPAALKVTLLEGRVTVGPLDRASPPIALSPGQQYIERGGTRTIRDLDGDDVTGWRRGLVDFDDDPLGEAAAQLNRYSRDRLVIRDPAVRALRVSGQFRAGDVDRFARTVAEVHPLRVVRRDREIELVSRR